MSVNEIDAKMIRKMFLAGAKALEEKKEYINELNVFPVPDGDTGTNMTMTIMSAAKEVSVLKNPNMEELAKAISSGSLRGARGNSGVILSQIFRGFVKSVKGNTELDVTVLGNAVCHASETAYKAVMKPKEGTILTVANAGAEKARELLTEGEIEDIIVFCDTVVDTMEETLLQTPEILPVLKEAGVVDSGGEGLMTFLRGAMDALHGRITNVSIDTPGTKAFVKADIAEEADIKFGYCTEFIIMPERNGHMVETQLKEYLQKIGDSIVVVTDDDIVKVHVHTNDPGLAIQKALTYGALTSMKIDNMREEHNEKVIKSTQKETEQKVEEEEVPHKGVGFIAVSAGDGLTEIFRDLGVDYLIEGGQTMNPSTEDMLEAIAQVNADTIFILPNNGNIILAANQAKELTKEKEIIVIPSKDIPQGITAMINYMSGKSKEENRKNMESEMLKIKSGQVTYAVRDTVMDGKEIKQGNFIGLTDKTILSVHENVQIAAQEMIEAMLEDTSELVSIYFGAEITEAEAEGLADAIIKEHEDIDVEIQYGGQPIYSYFISVE